MHNPLHYPHTPLLDLSIEALWLARVLQDGMDVLLEKQADGAVPPTAPINTLRISRDVFERLGIYGCSACRVRPHSTSWSAAARVELIRQLAVHWRAFTEAFADTPWGMALMQRLTPEETQLLEQIQQLGHTLHTQAADVVYCLQLEMDAMARAQATRQALRCLAFMAPSRTRKAAA